MYKQYPVIIERGNKNISWGIIVPDIQGCFSSDDIEQDIIKNARASILLHLEDVDVLPEPSSILDIRAKHKDSEIALVDVDIKL